MKISPRPTGPDAEAFVLLKVNEHDGTNLDVNVGTEAGPDDVLGTVRVATPFAPMPALMPSKIAEGQPALSVQPVFIECWSGATGAGVALLAAAPMS